MGNSRFLYNEDVTLVEEDVFLEHTRVFRIKPFACKFKIHGKKILIITVHLRYEDKDLRKEELKKLHKLSDYSKLVILGDFNCHPMHDLPEGDRMLSDYHCTHSNDQKTNTADSRAYNNILCNDTLEDTHLEGDVGKIRNPSGKKELPEKYISDHRPVWADFDFEDL